MTLKIHYLQHVPFEDMAFIQNWADEHGHSTSCTRLWLGESLPEINQWDWLVVMGGPMNIYEDTVYPWLSHEKEYLLKSFQKGKKMLGICLGAQLLAHVLGARISRNPHKEIGWFPIQTSKEVLQHPLFKNWPNTFTAFHWHGDTFEIPKNTIPFGHSDACPHQGFIFQNQVVGFQFHLESTSESIQKLIANCGEELIPAPFIQSSKEILSQIQNVPMIHNVMSRFLETFSKS